MLNVTIRHKTCGLWTLVIFPGILHHLKKLLVIKGCIKSDFIYKALQSLFKKNMRNVVAFELWSYILTWFLLIMSCSWLLVPKSYRRHMSWDANHKSMTRPLLGVTGIYEPWFSCLFEKYLTQVRQRGARILILGLAGVSPGYQKKLELLKNCFSLCWMLTTSRSHYKIQG